MNHDQIASAFDRDRIPFLRVSPHGFVVNDRVIPRFSAVTLDARLVRKRFCHGKLVCYSSSGDVAKDGSDCSDCSHLDDCTPRLRLRLKPALGLVPNPIFLELGFSSARNFLDYVKKIHSIGFHPSDAHTLFSCRDRGRWGEVLFSLDPAFLTDHLVPQLE